MKKVYILRVCFYLLLPLILLTPLIAQQQDQDEVLTRLKFKLSIEKSLATSFSRQIENYHNEYYDYLKHDFSGVENRTQRYMDEVNKMRAERRPEHEIIKKELEFWRVKRQELTAKMSTYQNEAAWDWTNISQDYLDMVAEDVIYIVKNIDWKEVFKPLIECITEFDKEKCKDVQGMLTTFALEAIEKTWKKNFIDDMRSELNITKKIAEDIWDSYVIISIKETDVQKLAKQAVDSLKGHGEKKLTGYLADKVTIDIDDAKIIGKSKEEVLEYYNKQAKEAAEKRAKSLFAATSFASDVFWKFVNIYAGLDLVDQMKPMVQNRMQWVYEAAGCSNPNNGSCAAKLNNYYLNDKSLRKRLKRLRNENSISYLPPRPGVKRNENSQDDALCAELKESRESAEESKSAPAPNLSAFTNAFNDAQNAFFAGELFYMNYQREMSDAVSGMSSTISAWKQLHPDDDASFYWAQYEDLKEKYDQNWSDCNEDMESMLDEFKELHEKENQRFKILKRRFDETGREINFEKIGKYAQAGDHTNFYNEKAYLFEMSGRVADLRKEMVQLLENYYLVLQDYACDPLTAGYFWEDGEFNNPGFYTITRITPKQIMDYNGCEDIEIPMKYLELVSYQVIELTKRIDEFENIMLRQASRALVDDLDKFDPVEMNLTDTQRSDYYEAIIDTDYKAQVENNYEELKDALRLYLFYLETTHSNMESGQLDIEDVNSQFELLNKVLAEFEYDLVMGNISSEVFEVGMTDTIDHFITVFTQACLNLFAANEYCNFKSSGGELRDHVSRRLERYAKLKKVFGKDSDIEEIAKDIERYEMDSDDIYLDAIRKFEFEWDGQKWYTDKICLLFDAQTRGGTENALTEIHSTFIPDRYFVDRLKSEVGIYEDDDLRPCKANYKEACFSLTESPEGFGAYLANNVKRVFVSEEDDPVTALIVLRSEMKEEIKRYLTLFESNKEKLKDCSLADELQSILDRIEANATDINWDNANRLAEKMEHRELLDCIEPRLMPIRAWNNVTTHWYIDPCIDNVLARYNSLKYNAEEYFDLTLNNKPISKWKEEWPDHNSIKIVQGDGKIKFGVDKVSPLLKDEIEKVQWRECRQPVHPDMTAEMDAYRQCVENGEYSLVAYQRADFTQTSQLDPDYVYQYDYQVVKKDGSVIVPTGSPIYVQWWKDDPDDIKPPEVVQKEGMVTLECFHGEGSYTDGYEFESKEVQREGETGVDKPHIKPDIFFSDNVFTSGTWSTSQGYKIASVYDYGQTTIDQVTIMVAQNDPGFTRSGTPQKGHTYGYYTLDGTFVLLEILNTYEKPYNHYHLNGVEFKWRTGDPSKASSASVNDETKTVDSNAKNLVVNGSFETPVVGAFQSFQPDQDMGGWIVINAAVDLVGSYFVSSDGKQSLDLHGTPGFGGIRQTLKTMPSQEYTVEFKMSGNPAGTPIIKVMQLIAAGQSKIFEFDCTGKTEQKMGWQTKKWSFVADSHLTTLAFVTMSKTGVANYGPVIDDVRVYPSSGSLTSNQDLVKNIAPHAQLAVTTVSGGSFTAPVQVQFNPQGSYDPDGQIALFELDKDGDGYFEVSEKGLHGASMEFTEPGTYTAMLRVTDDKGETKVASHTFQILSGNILGDDSDWYRINNWKPGKNGDGRYFTPGQDLCIESMVSGGVWFSTNRPYSIDHDYIVEFEVKMNETDNHFVILYSDGFVGIDIDWGIDLGHTQPGASYNLRKGLGNLTIGNWHKIRAEAHPADNTFDLYLNGNKVSTATGITVNHDYHTNTTKSLFDGNHDIVFIGDVDKPEFRGGNYNRGSTCWRNFRVSTSHFTGNKSQVNDEFDEIGYDIKLELDKTSFAPGEKIKVYFDRGDIGDNTAWLGIVPSGIAHDSEDENERFANQKKRVRQKDGNMIFFAPDEVGLYDIRFHDLDNEGREIASASFMVLEEGKVVDDVQVKEIHVDVSEQEYGPIIFKFSPLRVFEGLAHIGLEYELMKYFSVEADIGYYFNVPPMLYHEPLIPMKEIFDQSDEPWSDLWDLAESYTYWPLSDFWQNNGSGINLTGAFKYYFDGHLKGGYISGEYRHKTSSWSSNDEFDEAIEFDVSANAFNIVLGKQRQINNSMWTDVFIGWGIRDVKLETNFGGDPYEEKFYYNIVLGWKLGLRF